MAPLWQKKSFFAIGKKLENIVWLHLYKHYSGQKKSGPLYEILNTPLVVNKKTRVHHPTVARFNPQMPKVFRQPKTPKGGGYHPLDFCLSVRIFVNISHGYVFGVKESNGVNKKILPLLHDLENQGQTPFCMTFHICGCEHDTNSILVSFLTFSRSRISKML